LVSFFVMAYAFSWIVWSPWVLSEEGVGLLPFRLSDGTSGLLNAVAILAGPTLSALIMTGITEGRAGGLRWYLFALIGVPAVMALGTVILPGGIGSFGSLGLGYVLTYLALFPLIIVLGGPLFEEVG
jgi:hypothetical protein